MKLKHIIILQNKIDLVKESQAKEQYDQILKFVQGDKIAWICSFLILHFKQHKLKVWRFPIFSVARV